MREYTLCAGLIAGGFLLGSILFSKIIPKFICNIDICESSPDRNPGAANVFASCGVGVGLIVLALDMAKGFLPVFAGCRYTDTENLLFAFVMLAPVLGHAVGIFNRFHGGKCIATAFGVQIALFCVTWTGWLLAGFYILFSTLIVIRPNRIRSIVTFALFGISATVISILHAQYAVALGDILLSATVIAKHLQVFSESSEEENIEDTIEGTMEKADVKQHTYK